MYTIKNIIRSLFTLFLLFIFFTQSIYSQEFNLNNQASKLIVSGTSSLHDWHEVAENQTGKINFENLEACKIEKISIDIEAESLKSGKGAMDKNTYKALKTDKYITGML